MVKLAENKKFIKGMFAVLFLLACFQNISLVSVGTIALKPVHVFSLFFLPVLMEKRAVSINKKLWLYTVYVIVISLLNWKTFGIGGLLLNYVFGLYLITVCMNCGEMLSETDWSEILCLAAGILMAAVVIKNICGYKDFIWYFENPDKEHPWGLKTIIGGGLNIESSWLGLLAFFFYKSKWKWLYVSLNLLLSFLYGSRSGMLIAGAVIVWMLLPEVRKLKERKYRIKTVIVLVIIGAVLYGTGLYDAVIGRAVNRFFEGLMDRGSVARLRMWKYVLQTGMSYPFGCGAGNCMQALTIVSGETYVDGNLHNVYFQNLIEQGWLGGAVYLWMVLRFFWREGKRIISNPFVASLFCYCVISLLQFRGADTIACLILGAELVCSQEIWKSDCKIAKNILKR